MGDGRSSRSASSARSCPARRSGARGSPSPTPAPTSRRSRPARSATATTAGSSPARRCGRAARSTRAGACSSPAPTQDGRQAQGPDLLPDGHGAARRPGPARCARSPARRSSTSCSSRTRGSPTSNVIGGVGNGWKVALTTLMNERAGLAFFLQVRMRQLLDDLMRRGRRARAARRRRGRRPARRRCTCKAELLRLTAYRGLTAIEKYGQPGPEGSLTKWMWSDANQQLTQLAADAARPGRARRRVALGLRAAARARQHDRGRHDRDPQEHRRRARARPAAGARHELRLRPTTSARSRRPRASCSPAARRSSGCAPRPRRGATTTTLWRELGELGWPGIAVAEEHGGQGLGVVELAVLLEELGYAVAATPLLGTALAALAIEHAGTDAQRARWLPGPRVGRADRRVRARRPRRRTPRAPP